MDMIKARNAATRAAKVAFPRRLRAQEHFVRGWMANLGCKISQAAMTYSDAESEGGRIALDYQQLITA